MDDQKHLEILKQGVGIWNKWREANLDIRPNLSDADLHNTNLFNLQKGGKQKLNPTSCLFM